MSTELNGNWITGSIRNKLLAVFGLGMVVVLGSALFGFSMARSGFETVEKVNNSTVANAFAVAAMETDFKEQVQEWKNVLLRGSDPKQLEKYWTAFTGKEKNVRDAAKGLEQRVRNAQAKELLGKFHAAHEVMGQKYRQGLETFKSADFEPAKGDRAVKGMDREPAELLAAATKVIREDSANELAQVQKSTTQSLNVSLTIMLVLTVVTVAMCAFALIRMIVRPIGEAARIADAVAGGELAIKIAVTSNDEVGRLLVSLSSMRDNLTRIVRDVRENSQLIASAAEQISAGNTNLSQRTEEQASSLEETASSMEEMTSTVKQNADNAARANQMAEAARSQAEKGGQVVGQAVTAMDEINEASRKIADIISTIDGIAFQTNLLALNAAVEAARAGEQGRGFAVVATEVRNLAQRSATAAKEIKALIEDSVSKVGAGSKLVEQSGQTLNEIVVSVKKVSDVVADIAAASNEQSSGIEQVNQAVVQMDEMTQQNAALVEEAAAAGRSLEEQATLLAQLMGFFKLGDESKLGFARSAQVTHATPTTAHHPAITHHPQLKATGATARARAAAKPAPKIAAAPTHKPGGDGEWEKF
jgi:methyl-accepting chemotaxis protein-1 (serine sensor receptor)